LRRVLGVDPGTAITGWGIVESSGEELKLVACGAITTTAGQPMPERLQILYRELAALIVQYQPTEAAVEELFFSRNTTTALSVGQARGVALLALAQAGLTVHEYKPLEVKQAIVGYGRATKDQVQQLVRMLLNLDFVPQPDDAADAIAIAICHCHSAKWASLVTKTN